MDYFTKNIDIDREILLKLKDEDLRTCCGLNKYFLKKVCGEKLFLTRLTKIYPDVLNIPDFKDKLSYKQLFLKTIHYISKLKEEYDYQYVNGDPEFLYKILSLMEIKTRIIENCTKEEICGINFPKANDSWNENDKCEYTKFVDYIKFDPKDINSVRNNLVNAFDVVYQNLTNKRNPIPVSLVWLQLNMFSFLLDVLTSESLANIYEFIIQKLSKDQNNVDIITNLKWIKSNWTYVPEGYKKKWYCSHIVLVKK